jgi:hypothetical protein
VLPSPERVHCTLHQFGTLPPTRAARTLAMLMRVCALHAALRNDRAHSRGGTGLTPDGTSTMYSVKANRSSSTRRACLDEVEASSTVKVASSKLPPGGTTSVMVDDGRTQQCGRNKCESTRLSTPV